MQHTMFPKSALGRPHENFVDMFLNVIIGILPEKSTCQTKKKCCNLMSCLKKWKTLLKEDWISVNEIQTIRTQLTPDKRQMLVSLHFNQTDHSFWWTWLGDVFLGCALLPEWVKRNKMSSFYIAQLVTDDTIFRISARKMGTMPQLNTVLAAHYLKSDSKANYLREKQQDPKLIGYINDLFYCQGATCKIEAKQL